MTSTERKIATALMFCTFLPGCFDKRFVKQLPKWNDRDMTEKGRAKMIELLHKYRRQIPNYTTLKNELLKQITI
jgi:hypothetical protein